MVIESILISTIIDQVKNKNKLKIDLKKAWVISIN